MGSLSSDFVDLWDFGGASVKAERGLIVSLPEFSPLADNVRGVEYGDFEVKGDGGSDPDTFLLIPPRGNTGTAGRRGVGAAEVRVNIKQCKRLGRSSAKSSTDPRNVARSSPDSMDLCVLGPEAAVPSAIKTSCRQFGQVRPTLNHRSTQTL